MKKVGVLLLLAIASVTFVCAKNSNVQSIPIDLQEFISKNLINNSQITTIPNKQFKYCKIKKIELNQIKRILYLHSDTLNINVINTVLTTIKCSRERNIQDSNILTIIDYSLPSSEKRLWIFDLKQGKLLFHTYISHGIKTGTLDATYFSNKVNSQASSLGVFMTGNSYYGRHGLSLKLLGLDKDFNDKAYQRSIVMHAAWYVDKDFIAKYGRVGRSWGCPAVPKDLAKPIINLIKDQSLFVIYYPSDQWFLRSKFLNCDKLSSKQTIKNIKIASDTAENESRGEVIFIDRNNNNQREETDPILVMTAENYQRIFNAKAPLKRMLRRQINNTEYIALNSEELKILDSNNDNVIDGNDSYGLTNIALVIPLVLNNRGYYETQFRFVDFGKIAKVKLNSTSDPYAQQLQKHTIYFSNGSAMSLRTTDKFIRWLGL